MISQNEEMAVSGSKGQLVAGHVGFGNIVRPTLEAIVVFPPHWTLTRELDPTTGLDELFIEPRA